MVIHLALMKMNIEKNRPIITEDDYIEFLAVEKDSQLE